MTHPGNDPTPLWLRVAPIDAPAEFNAFWTRRVGIPRHHVIERALEPPDGAPAEDPDTLEVGTWDTILMCVEVPE